MTYDVHAHCIPQRVVDEIRTGGDDLGVEIADDGARGRLVVAGTPTRMPLHPGLTDVDARIAAMDAAGVAIQLLSSWIDLTAYALPPGQGERARAPVQRGRRRDGHGDARAVPRAVHRAAAGSRAPWSRCGTP